MVQSATVGIIANPASSRDIRRIVARGPATTTNDKINSLARLMEGLAATGVRRVVSMSDAGGIAHGLASIAKKATASHWPELCFVDQEITHSPMDTVNAARSMGEQNVGAIVVLGGDGTNRLLLGETGDTPVASISTGTNNAFPRHDEPTVVGFAAGYVATGRIDPASCTYRAKSLTVTAGEDSMGALVDVAIVQGDRIASGAVWEAGSLREVFLCFAEADAVGLSSIGGHLQPIGRGEPEGLHVQLDDTAPRRVTVPIAPGLIRELGVSSVSKLALETPVSVHAEGGVISVDGERSMRFAPGTTISVSLNARGPLVLDIGRAMSQAIPSQAIPSQETPPITTTKGEDTHG